MTSLLPLSAQVAGVREFAGLARMASRGVIRVTGEDARRWLDGMVSNDVASLAPGPEGSGCYAVLLTPQGRIVSDFHILLRPEGFWLETRRDAIPAACERLERYVIADDVTLCDVSSELDQLGLEGPAAPGLLAAASRSDVFPVADSAVELEIGGVSVVAAAFGWSGEPAFQLLAPHGSAAAVEQALRDADLEGRMVEVGPEAIEVLRIEAGVPLLGAELDESVLPDEAGLDRAISTTKGCYTGQEVVARLRSQGRVKHRLVSLRFDGEPPPPDTELFAANKRTGEVTSACTSPDAGAIGLGYVRVADLEAGHSLSFAGGSARVAAAPDADGA